MTLKPCLFPTQCRKLKRGPCSCSFTAEDCAAISVRNTGRKYSAASIAKQLETKKKKGLFFIPPNLRGYYKNLMMQGYDKEERRKLIGEIAQW